MKAVSSKQRSWQPSREFVVTWNKVEVQDGKMCSQILSKVQQSRKKLQLTVLLSGGSKVESSHTVKLYVLFPHLATRLSSEKRRKGLKERHIARKLTVQTDPAEVLGGWVWYNLSLTSRARSLVWQQTPGFRPPQNMTSWYGMSHGRESSFGPALLWDRTIKDHFGSGDV